MYPGKRLFSILSSVKFGRGAARTGMAVIAAASVCLLAPGPATARSLAGQIAGLLASPQLRGASVGINIVELTKRGPSPIYSFHPRLALMPGSNGKLLTTSAIFDRLGSRAMIQTRLYQVGDNLVIVGGGDPALGDPVLCQRAGWKVTTPFDNWATHLKALRDTHFHDIVVDDSIFNQHFRNPKWPGDGQRLDWYEAPVGGLNFSLNCVQWTPVVYNNGGIGVKLVPESPFTPVTIQAHRGPLQSCWMWRAPGSNHFYLRGQVRSTSDYAMQATIYDPGLFTGNVLRQSLVNQGISISGVVKRGTLAASAATGGQPRLLATYETPLLDILHRANTDSINLMAECMCKLLGHLATGQPGSWANGDAAIMSWLGKMGVGPQLVHMVDGSGLSHFDHIAPVALTAVLSKMAYRSDGRAFIDTLCRPGHGTLIHRFMGSPVGRHVRAKDGHITGASTISGYLFVGHRTFVFSIMCNYYHGNVNPWQDRLVIDLYNWALHH